jgi:hypothetical protein
MVITQKMNVVNTKHVHLKLIKMASFTAYQKKKKKKSPGMMVHICNSSHAQGRDQEH